MLAFGQFSQISEGNTRVLAAASKLEQTLQALFMISGLDESAFISRASLIAHEHRSPLTPDAGPRLYQLEGPDVATALSGAEGWGRGLEPSTTGGRKDAAAPASARSCADPARPTPGRLAAPPGFS